MSDQVQMTTMNYAPDRPKAENPVKIEDLSLRDGHQSLFATRGRTEDMIPVAEQMDEIGFWAMETWGGATFDTMHRYLQEDPWQRLRTLKKYIKKTPFSMLLRAQNLVGYRNYADDLATAFVERSAENGMDIFRTFDALNDYRNFETVVKAIKKAGKHFQGCMCYTITEPRLGGDVYNLDYYVGKAKDLESMGADSICVKDMAGLLAPYDAYNLIKALKAATRLPIHLHSHFTSGMADMTMLKAIEAGVDIIDTCMSPYALRTSHPAIEPIVMALLGTNRDTGFDIRKLVAIDTIMEREILPKYRHLLDNSKTSVIDINVLLHQTPGGMLSNLVNQLRAMDALNRIDDVFKELPRVRKDLGQVPLVTPTSQIVGVQTVNNVLLDPPGERYSKITDQVKDLCYGLYGKTAVPINPEVQKKALKGYARGETPTTKRPADELAPELEKAKQEIGSLAKDLDDVILYAQFPTTGRKFLEWKYGKTDVAPGDKKITLEEARKMQDLVNKARQGKVIEIPEKGMPEKSPNVRTFNVFVDGEYFSVDVDPTGDYQPVAVAPRAAAAAPRPAAAAAARPAAAAPAPAALDGTPLTAPMPGLIIKYDVAVGAQVKKGDAIVVLEAMKMENSLTAPCDGTVKSLSCKAGDSVAKDAVLAVIG